MATVLEETIRGVRIVKAFTMENFEIGRFYQATKRHLASTLKAQKNPRLLFLSTHGYYEEHAWGKHPLLRSGLALAGANGSVFAGGAGPMPMAAAPQGATLTVPVLGAAPTVADDGILTGLEAVS